MKMVRISDRFRGGPSQLRPPPLGDRLTQSLAVMLMLNFDRSTAKHGTQNIQNKCHQWLSDSFKVHQIRFRPGQAPDPTGGGG